MEYVLETTPVNTLHTDCLIIGVYKDLQLTHSATSLNENILNIINKVLARGDNNGELACTLLINALPDSSIERILLVGLGDQKALSGKNFRKALQAVFLSLKKTQVKLATCTLADVDVCDSDRQWKTRQIIEIANDTAYQFTTYKSNKDVDFNVDKITVTAPESELALAQLGLSQGIAIADGINLTKLLSDLPGNICTPTYLAEQAIALGSQYDKLSINVLEEADMEQLGMGALLSVSRGSRQPAKLITLDYQGGDKNVKPIVLIGKGLTFDAGGISLKPGLGMDEMKYDMCGGATVLGTLKAAAEMQLPLNIIGLIPSSENLPDGDANKPGDILISMSGKTIEVLNTDAEGRLLLCDTLTYAERFNPDVVIDMATLTGACLVALGRVPSGLLGNCDALCNDLIAASEVANDSLWRLPLWEEYQEQLKSNFADLANIGGKDAGTITAACFLSQFAEKFNWAHLDIAGTAWRTGQNKGATGRPVPLLTQYLLNRAYG